MLVKVEKRPISRSPSRQRGFLLPLRLAWLAQLVAVAAVVGGDDLDSAMPQFFGHIETGFPVDFRRDNTESAAFDGRWQTGLVGVVPLREAVTKTVRRDAQSLLADTQTPTGQVIEPALCLLPSTVRPAQTPSFVLGRYRACPIKNLPLFVAAC